MPLLKFEVPEEDEQEIDDIISLVETEITNKNFSISNVTSKLSLTPKRLSILTKRAFKRSFDKYILALRIEIVKERLRSSNASEIFITKSCGFSSVAEMEKKFQSLIGITPHKYREKNIFI
jgi:two-component system response regulator YesN